MKYLLFIFHPHEPGGGVHDFHSSRHDTLESVKSALKIYKSKGDYYNILELSTLQVIEEGEII